MFSIFLSNKKCGLEHVVNKLTSCLINEFLWILILAAGNEYRTSSILQGTVWNSMELQGQSMEFHGITGNSMELHGIP